MLKVHQGEIISWVDYEQFVLLVTSMIYSNVLVDKLWVQDLLTIVARAFFASA